MSEPRPDIHELFCHYNSLYFSEALGTCIVSWAPCLISMAASCDFIEEGLCEIQLSVPLLKSRSSADIKNILLHEMIHAFLWIIHRNNNHSDHGAKFWFIANFINSNDMDDDKRPSNGYNITAHHGFQNEDYIDNFQLWMCTSCGDLIKRGMIGEPSPMDCIEKNNGDDCGKLLCGWHRHSTRNLCIYLHSTLPLTAAVLAAVRGRANTQVSRAMHNKLCSGRYEKVDDAPGFKNKDKSIGVQENVGDNHSDLSQSNRQRLLPAEEIKDKRVIKRPKIMAEYYSSILDKPKNTCKKSSQAADHSNTGNRLIVLDLKSRSLAAGPEIPRQLRSSYKKICNLPNAEANRNHKRRREITLVIQLFGVCTDEESEEDTEPLINKRSERRKKMKLVNSSDGRVERTAAGLSPHEVISLD